MLCLAGRLTLAGDSVTGQTDRPAILVDTNPVSLGVGGSSSLIHRALFFISKIETWAENNPCGLAVFVSNEMSTEVTRTKIGVIPDRREPYRRVPLGRVHLDERRLDEVQ